MIRGGENDDVLLGDNGEILRELLSLSSSYPWVNGMIWKHYPAPFDSEVIRDVRRYDDIDDIQVRCFLYDHIILRWPHCL